jgi:4-amino-4-deoxy-L-arabinose transferase-like glycosyltransferase
VRTPPSSPWPLAATALVAVAAQIALLAQKDVLILEWRPTDLAAIALNYYRHGFDFLYPQILWGGNGPGYVEMEFPLIPYAIALLYAVFGVHDWAALALPMLSGIGLAILMNLFTTRFYGALAGLLAGLFVASSPTWLAMSTGVWPDAPPIFFGALGLYLLTRWLEDDAPWRVVLAAACISLAILLKLTSLYLGFPIAFLFWVKYRHAWWRAPRVWMFGVLVLLAPVLWYIHAYRLFLQYHNTFGIIASGYLKFGNAELLTDPWFYIRTFVRLVLFQTTPLGFLLVAIGSVGRVDRAVQYLFHVWLGSVLLYLLVAAEGVSIGHYQYALPLVAPCAALAGHGLATLVRHLESRRWMLGAASPRMAAFAIALFLAANTAAANYLNESRGMNFREASVLKMKTGRALARLSAPDDLIVVVDANMDDRTPETSMTPPEVFYFSDRRGWYRAMSWLTAESIEDLRMQGAHYLAVSAHHVRWFRTQYSDLYGSCSRRYQTLLDSDEGIVYDLTAPPGDAVAR